MKPNLAFLLLELHVGIGRLSILLSAVLRGRSKVSVILEGGPVGLGPGIRVRILVVYADRRLHVPDPGSVCIDTDLRGGRESLVQVGEFSVLIHDGDHDIRVVDVLAVGNERNLILFGVGRYQRVPVPEKSPVVPEGIVPVFLRERGSALESHIAEPALFVFLLQGHVQHFFPVAVLDPGGAGFLGFPVDDTDLVHDGGRKVVQRRTLVVEEEGPSPHGEFVDFLAVELHLSVIRDFHARHALEQVLEHGVGSHPERGGIEFHRIFFDDDGIAHVGHRRCLQELFVHLQPDRAQVLPAFPEIPALHDGPVAHHLHMQRVAPERDILQLRLALRISEGKVRDGGVLLGDHIERRIRNGLVGKRVHNRRLDLRQTRHPQVVIEHNHLCPESEAGEQDAGRYQEFLHLNALSIKFFFV